MGICIFLWSWTTTALQSMPEVFWNSAKSQEGVVEFLLFKSFCLPFQYALTFVNMLFKVNIDLRPMVSNRVTSSFRLTKKHWHHVETKTPFNLEAISTRLFSSTTHVTFFLTSLYFFLSLLSWQIHLKSFRLGNVPRSNLLSIQILQEAFSVNYVPSIFFYR